MGVWETDIRHEAMREGMQQGMQEKAVVDALNLLKKTKLSPEVIAECCSLPIDEVNRLDMEQKKETVQA